MALAVAIGGGAAATMMVMSAKPAARDAAPSAATRVAAPERPAAVPEMSAQTPKWTTATASRWVNGRKNAAFEVAAERPVQVWMKHVTPSLVVRCADRRVDVFVFTETAARIEPEDQDHTVRIRLDDEPGGHERWPDSVEHDALFAPDGKALLQRLKAAKTLTFGFSPHNAAPVNVKFDVRGLAEIMGPAAARCGR